MYINVHNKREIFLLNQYLLAHAAVFFGQRWVGLDARVLGHVVPRPHPDECLEIAPPLKICSLPRVHGAALCNQGELTGSAQALVVAFFPVAIKSDLLTN